MKDKINLQTVSIDQREKALEKEKEFRYTVHANNSAISNADTRRRSELKASMSASGVSAEAQQKLLGLHERNIKLSAEVKDLQDKLDVLSTSGDTHTYVGHLTISVRLQCADTFRSIRSILLSNMLKSPTKSRSLPSKKKSRNSKNPRPL